MSTTSNRIEQKHALQALCAKAVQQQIERDSTLNNKHRNRRRHLLKHLLKRLPYRRTLSNTLKAASLVLASWGLVMAPQTVQAASTPSFAAVTGAANPLDGVVVPSFIYQSATPSFADLDGDGDLDAVLGSYGGTVKYYQNTGTANAPILTAVVGALNPFNGIDVGFRSTPSFVDIDGDGDLDAFIGESSGILNYYRNTGTANAPVFTPITGAANPLNGFDVGLRSAPSFADIDGDGDLDAFVGEAGNGTVKYYQNTGTANAPVFVAANGTTIINPLAGLSVNDNAKPSFVDVDGDGDLDAFIGRGDGTLTYMQNTGTAIAPLFTAVAPHPLTAVLTNAFSAPSFVDIDGDGDLDAFIGAKDGFVRFYKNTAVVTPPSFAAVTGASNPLNGFDVGKKAAPSFADLDGDGDLDAFVGEYYGTVKYYQNTGTSSAPVFLAVTGAANPLNGVALYYSIPSFSDLDGDGDLDAFVGEKGGTVKYYQNTGTATAPVFTAVTGVSNPLNGFDVGFNSKPSFSDIDGDGDLDAFVASDAAVKYYQNTGTSTAPVFASVTGAANPLNGVTAYGYLAPSFVDIDGDGDLDAFVGEYDYGTVKYYENTGTVNNPIFIATTGAANPLNGLLGLSHPSPSFTDIDGDGDLDVFVGEFNGTVKYYQNGPVSAPALSITTSGSLAAGTVGAAYSQTLAATGGTSPYTWAITAGTLPAGLALNTSTGVVSGTATAAGTASVTFQATDAASATASVVLSLTINQANQALTFAPTGTANVGGNATLSATSDSGLTVTAFGTSTPSICTVTGTGVTYDAAGTCTLTADQAGNGNYLAATQATANVIVSASANNVTATGATGTGATMGNVVLNFTNATSTGLATKTATTSNALPTTGLGSFKFGSNGQVFDIVPGATFTGAVEVCITYDPTQFPDENGLQLVHLLHGTNTWETITTTLNAVTNVICGNTLSFSHFGVVHPSSTFVSLTDFSATVNADNAVTVNWATDVEIDHYGFELLREDVVTGASTVLNTQLSNVANSSGGQYRFTDTTADAGKAYLYTLVDISTQGIRTEHGPLDVSVTAGNAYAFDPQSNATAVTLSHATPSTGGGAMSLFNLLALLMFVPLMATRRKLMH